MKQILISSFDMSIGGVERSLINMLGCFDYKKYQVDLMLYKHDGEFFSLLPKGHTLLTEIPEYATFRMGISEIIKAGQYKIALARLAAKYVGQAMAKQRKYKELGLIPMQLGWKYANRKLPKIEKEYDAAISYLWPHYFVAEKVKAKTKIAWIHTDYSFLEIDNELDAKMWDKFQRIIAVSEECKNSFLRVYPQLKDKVTVVENITSPDFINQMAEENINNEINPDNKIIKIVTVARLAYPKGIDNAIKACRILLDNGYKVIWYVVGYGGEEENLKQDIEKLNLKNNFILLGKKLNPYPYIKACDIYVQPSRYEAKAVTVTEAQILGKPVLITNYNTAASQVKSGYDGIISDIGVEGIVEGIKRLIDSPEILERLKYNTKITDYTNTSELNKLYELI